MVVCFFGMKYREDADLAEESRVYSHLLEVLEEMPGFISYHGYKGGDGEVVGVVRFESRGALEAWRDNPIHRAAWERAPAFYEEFWVQNCESFREYVWRNDGSHDTELVPRFRRNATTVGSLADAS